MNFNVQPDYVHREGREPPSRDTCHQHDLADVRQLNQVGRSDRCALLARRQHDDLAPVLRSNTEVARRTALAGAIAKARADAEEAAGAAGGSLGPLLEKPWTASFPQPMPMIACTRCRIGGDGYPNPAGQESLVVMVSTRGGFIAM